MKNLYSFYLDCGRMGSLDGLFIATSEDVAEAIGKMCYFGEVLGKHSEVYGELEDKHIKLESDEQDKVEWLCSLMSGNTIAGFNPLEYIDEEMEGC